MSDSEASVIHRAYGLLTDHHASGLTAEELRAELRPLVTNYSLDWPLMVRTSIASTSDSNSVSISSIQRPSLRFFDTPRVVESV